jgi:hypothetical protein
MAIYPIIHKETGEKKVIKMSVDDIMQWYNDNPEWKRDWSEGCATPGEVGEWKDKLNKRNPSWNEVLKKVGRVPGSRVTKN